MNQANLRILQLNMMKSRAGMEALINDQQTADLDILLIQEAPLSTYRTHVNHHLWHRYQSTSDSGNDNDNRNHGNNNTGTNSDNTRKRSLLYVNKRISTSAHRQIRCSHPDVVAIETWTEHGQALIFSVYIQPVDYRRLYESAEHPRYSRPDRDNHPRTHDGVDSPNHVNPGGRLQPPPPRLERWPSLRPSHGSYGRADQLFPCSRSAMVSG